MAISRQSSPSATLSLAGLTAVLLAGCANPGPPHAPSLFLPAPVVAGKIAANRIGNEVDVRFTVPARSTDNLPLRAQQISGSLCRQMETGPCEPVSARISVAAKGADGQPNVVTWQDTLPADLATGAPRAIGYRVEFYNAAGVSGGKSDPAIAAAGAAPPAVAGLTAEGSRAGVVLRWKPASAAAGEVLIRREYIPTAKSTPASRNKPDPGVQSLSVDTTKPGSSARVLDTTALPNVAYRYTAERSLKVQLGGRELEMRSAPSAQVDFTLREIYAPSAPTGLTALGFATDNSPFAVDLIWQPVNEPAVTGYNIYRQPINASGAPLSPRTLLTAKVTLPGFHDATAAAGTRYRYEVTAVDAHGNESTAATTVLEPTPR